MEDLDDKNYSENKNGNNLEFIHKEISKRNKFIKTHTSFEENTINEENYDITNFNYNYQMKNKINNENEEEEEREEEEDENDISSEDEYEYKLKNIKLGILRVKLYILCKIIISKIQKYYFYFLSKTNLKIQSNEIFLEDDNFLYSKLRLKTSDANKFYALKKLIFVIRKNSYEKLMKQNYFYHWKIKSEEKYLFNNNNKSDKINIIQFCSILMRILNKKFEYKYYIKYFVNKWKFLLKEKEIHNNNIKKGMILLSSLFNRKIRKVFKKFPRNFLNIKQKAKIFKAFNNNENIIYIVEDNEKLYQKGLQDFYNYKKKYNNLLKQNKLLKIIEKLDIKNKVNINSYKFFYLLKNSSKVSKYKNQIKTLNNSLTDLKYDSMLNAAIIIKIILNEHIYNGLFKDKKIFLERLYTLYKLNIIKYKYNSDEKFYNDEEKSEIKNMRLKYQRIYALQKILIINNRHKLYYGDLNIQLKFPLLMKYFKTWKKNVFQFTINEYTKKLASQKIFLLLNNIYLNRCKRNTFFIIIKKSIQNKFKEKKYYYFSFFIYLLLKQHILINISQNIFHFIKQIWINQQNSKLNDKNKYLQSIKFYLIYKKYLDIKKYKSLIKWNFICSCHNKKKKQFQEKIKLILINSDKSYNNHLLAKIFNNWRKKVKENQADEQKRQMQIYFYLNNLIVMKHLKTLWLNFKKWSAIVNNLSSSFNYDNLLIKLEQIRRENDNLIAIYYKKRQEYAKTLYDYNYMKKFYCEACINEKEDEIDYMSLKSSDIREAGKVNDSLVINQNKMNINKDNYKNSKKSFGDNTSYQRVGLPISFDENNFIVNEENKFQTDNSKISLNEENDLNNYIGKKIPQCDGETINSKNLSGDDNINNVFHNIDNNDINNDNINDYKKEYEEQKKYYENYISILLEKKTELIEMKNMLINQRLNTSKSE